MRGHLVLLTSLGLMLASACGDSGGSDGGTGSGTTGGTTGGTSGGTTGGGDAGNLPAGTPCIGNASCQSGICGVTGGGRCCTAACMTTDATCKATTCSNTGACVYPGPALSCGTPSCTGSLITQSACDGNGTCTVAAPVTCPGDFQCKDAKSCLTQCSATTDCAPNFYCNASTHHCIAQKTSGSCTANEVCISGVCGLNGTGNCCAAQCAPGADPACDPTSCDATTAACIYPNGSSCGTPASCSVNVLTSASCDSVGACNSTTGACPNNLVCNTAGTACLNICATTIDCDTGFYCSNTRCLPKVATGGCNTNEGCFSGICGVAGHGECCTALCDTTDPACGATDCDPQGACIFPNNKTACGAKGSCSGITQTDPTTCDGVGACQPQGTTDCTPYICGPTACLKTCKDSSSCTSGGFCDTGNRACCSGLINGGSIAVDSATGSDTTACCGIGTNGACQTIGQAMALIDAAQAQNVTINATVKGAGGDWAAAETYPIVLGWGAELSAPAVFFVDAKGFGNASIFDITNYSTSDTLGYASIVGTAKSPVGVGMDSSGNQLNDVAALAVEASNTLYLANASVNGSIDNPGSKEAILVQAGATLMLGQDQSGGVTGTVFIGNALGQDKTNGSQGIVCGTDGVNLGCTIEDAPLVGQSSVVIEGQEDLDIDAEDFASISLTSSPVIGVPPKAAGFNNCPTKNDGIFGQGMLLNGMVSFTFNNGTVQCIGGRGFDLKATSNGTPTLSIDQTLIQNTDVGLYGGAGSTTLTNATFSFNYNGVQQAQDSNGKDATVDLSGGGNTVVCDSNAESSKSNSAPGIAVYNTSASPLNASNVAWDTSAPDYFACDPAFTGCTCNISSCTVSPGSDGMDAVEDSGNLAGVTTASNTLSSITCN